MDNKKDSKNILNYSKGQSFKTIVFKESLGSPLVTAVDIKDIEVRIEKLSVAMFLVVSLIQKDNKLRLGIEEDIVKLVKYSRNLHIKNSQNVEDVIVNMITIIHTILSLFNIGETVGLISSMNSNVIKEQLVIVSTNLLEIRNNERNYEDYLLELSEGRSKINFGNLFNVEKRFSVKTEHNYKGQILTKGQNVFNNSTTKFSEKDRTVISKKDDLSLKAGRRNIIINILKDKGQVTIKDITNVITDCSEKTIQRELMAMVNENVLDKIGEKRWSKYIFKK